MLTFLRRFGLTVLSFALLVTLLLLALFWTLNRTIGEKETIKSWLSESQTYKTTIDSAVKNFDINKQLEGDSPDKKQDGGNIDSEAVKTAITASLTPETLQNVANNVIDGFYGWLSDENEKIEFSVDLASTKAVFIDSIVASARNRVEPLADCSPQQLQGDVEIFSIACRPPEAFIVQGETELRKNLTSEEFFPDTVITDETVFNADSSKPGALRFEEKNSGVQDYYVMAKKVFIWLLILAVALAVFVAFLGKTFLKGLGHVVKILMLAAMIVAAGSIIINVLSSSLTIDKFDVVNKTEASDKIMPEVAVNLVNYVGPKISSELFVPAIGYTVASLTIAALIVVLIKMNKKKEKAVPAESAPEANEEQPVVPKTEDNETPEEESTKEPEKKKPTPVISDIKPPKA